MCAEKKGKAKKKKSVHCTCECILVANILLLEMKTTSSSENSRAVMWFLCDMTWLHDDTDAAFTEYIWMRTLNLYWYSAYNKRHNSAPFVSISFIIFSSVRNCVGLKGWPILNNERMSWIILVLVRKLTLVRPLSHLVQFDVVISPLE